MHQNVRVLPVKRSPLESRGNLTKRHIIKNPDCDEHMIGEVQVNEEVEYSWPELKQQIVHHWHQKKRHGKLRELQSQNDFMKIHRRGPTKSSKLVGL